MSSSAERYHGHILSKAKLVHPKVFVFDVKHSVAAHIERWAFALKFEYDHSTVVASSKEVLLRMRRQNPEPARVNPTEFARSMNATQQKEAFLQKHRSSTIFFEIES